MDAVLDTLRERGYATATVWSFTDNERANAFYERLGFTRDGARAHRRGLGLSPGPLPP